jgi:hypothetical protein
MGMKGIARYMHFSRAIDLSREKDRYFRLPESEMRRTVLMTSDRAATFSAACSRRVFRAL